MERRRSDQIGTSTGVPASRLLWLALALLGGAAILAGCGANGLVVATPSVAGAPAPEAVVRAYFAALSSGDAERALALSGPDRLAPADDPRITVADLRRAYAHSTYMHFVSLKETAESLAQPATQRAHKRQYVVQLDIRLANPGPWNPGRNARFVGVLKAPNGWRVDAIDTSPGFLDCDEQGHCQFPTPVAVGTTCRCRM